MDDIHEFLNEAAEDITFASARYDDRLAKFKQRASEILKPTSSLVDMLSRELDKRDVEHVTIGSQRMEYETPKWEGLRVHASRRDGDSWTIDIEVEEGADCVEIEGLDREGKAYLKNHGKATDEAEILIVQEVEAKHIAFAVGGVLQRFLSYRDDDS